MLRAWAHPSPFMEAQTSGHQAAAGARMHAGRTGCIRAWLIAMALVSTVVSTPARVAQAQEDRVEAECRHLLHRSVFNCGCTAEFLEDHLGSEQADILLRLWTYGENVSGQHDEMLDLYRRYGSEESSGPGVKFHPPRELPPPHCPPGAGPPLPESAAAVEVVRREDRSRRFRRREGAA